jgi:transcriptional regulator GlxA family with amidase domain
MAQSIPEHAAGHRSRRVGILLFEEVEVLDACGPFEVFSVAGGRHGLAPFEVRLVAESLEPVAGRNGFVFTPHERWADAAPFDVLIVPAGPGTRRAMLHPATLAWVRERAAAAELVLSVCTGALILATAGLLDGLAATTHHGAIDLLRESAPRTRLLPGHRVVDNGRVVTSAGVAAGIDMSLHIVGRLLGPELARETADYMEYPWRADADPAPTSVEGQR